MMAMKTILNVEGKEVKIIIDTRAATSVIINKLRKELDIPIQKGSNVRFVLADGNKIAALGRTEVEIYRSRNNGFKRKIYNNKE
jgi:hypothetical protein